MKSTLDDLAIFGGPAAFTQPLHVGRPNIGDRARLRERIDTILDSKWLTNEGPFVQAFEQRLTEHIGVRHAIVTANGTIALQIAAKALRLAGEVIVPAFTFVATAHALEWEGLTPVFCDVDPATHNLDPAAAERAITSHTSAIVGVHVWGRPCAVDALEVIARRHRIKLLFDAAHALGCAQGSRMIGCFGDAEVFSFHATKFVNSFEGGAITTDNDELAARMRLMKNFGFVDVDHVVALGINAKMPEICAAMGLTSLESQNEWMAINRRNHDAYGKYLAGLPGVSLVTYSRDQPSNFQYVAIEIDEAQTGIGRDALQQILQAEGVIARRYFFPGCHRMEPYRSRRLPVSLPHTDALTRRVLCLPTGQDVDESAIALICNILLLAAGRGREASARVDGAKR